MARKTVYHKLPQFKPYLQRLLIDKASFTISETSFTKKIVVDELTLIFNEEGRQDNEILQLISRVRHDAKSFDTVGLAEKEKNINWCDLTEKPPEATIAKVDIKGAYWSTALKLGVITQNTNEYLLDKFKDAKKLKSARLKALGSLATKRNITQYVNGKPVAFSTSVEPTKSTYMHVCGVLDELMKRITMEIPGAFYYYVDCVFVTEKTHKDVINYIVKAEYQNTVEYTEIDTLDIGGVNYLMTQKDDKMYLIPRKRAFLLNA